MSAVKYLTHVDKKYKYLRYLKLDNNNRGKDTANKKISFYL
jgi:hypothetical protein